MKTEEPMCAAPAFPVERDVRPLVPKRQKPGRRELLRVIDELQSLIGEAAGAAENDRAVDRAQAVRGPLQRAFDLCVAAKAFDPPINRKRLNAKAHANPEAKP